MLTVGFDPDAIDGLDSKPLRATEEVETKPEVKPKLLDANAPAETSTDDVSPVVPEAMLNFLLTES